MTPFQRPLTADDFRRHGWQDVLAQAPLRDCFDYSCAFYAKAHEARGRKDEAATSVFTVLAAVTEPPLDPDEPDEPLGPRFVLVAGRSPGPRDMHESHLTALEELVPEVSDSEMRARICDVLWMVGRRKTPVDRVVEAYLESASVLENPEMWVSRVERIQRAVRVAKNYGSDGLFEKSVRHVEGILTRLNGDDSHFMSGMLMELLQEFKKGDPVRYAVLAEKGAMRAESEGGSALERANRYWRIEARWHELAKDEPNRISALMRAAETHVLEADQALKRPPEGSPHTHAAFRLEQAILALKKLGGQDARTRAEELHPRLAEQQRESIKEFLRFPGAVDVTDMAVAARSAVSDLPLSQALWTIGQMCSPPALSTLRELAQDEFSSPVRGLFYTRVVGRNGAPVAKAPAYDASPESAEAAVRAEMYCLSRRLQRCAAGGRIFPALGRVRAQHAVQLMDFYRLAEASPLVQAGREWAYAKGLHAGFKGDFMVAVHLLIPQVEHGIRCMLQARGTAFPPFNAHGIQNELDLNTTLRMEEVGEMFGEDALFDLRGLLIEHHGTNLRNLVAHGLLDDGAFHAEEAVYLWGIALRLCFLRPLDDSWPQCDIPTTG